MALYVQKFGGSSVGTIERIQHVAEIIQKSQAAGHEVVAVVSAMQGETDRLIELARQIDVHPEPREYDALVATGEQVSAALLAMALQKLGCQANSFNGAQAGIYTNQRHRKARIADINTDILLNAIHAGQIPIVAGFQGVDEKGDVATLGRGGSDITAVALAAALNADECQIFTDVDGVYTSDPRIVKAARCLQQITYAEMLALAEVGAKVLQTRSVAFAHKYNVPLRVLSSLEESAGTLIKDDDNLQLDIPTFSGVACDRNQAKLTVVGLPKQANYTKQFIDAMREAAIDIDMVVENANAQQAQIDFSFTVPVDEYAQAMLISKKLAKTFPMQDVIGDKNIAKLSLIGRGIKSHAGVSTRIFNVLGEQGIHIHLITSSEVKISAVIDEAHIQQGACVLHDAFLCNA